MKINGCLLILFFFIGHAYGQGLAPRYFTFAEVPASARQVGLGSINISGAATDLSLFWSNPALLSDTLHQQLSLGYQGYYRSSIFQTAYARHLPWFTVAAGVTAWNFGTIAGYDEAGLATGNITTGAYLISLALARQQGPFSLGLALKLAGNQLATSSGTAMLVDVGGTYTHPTQDLRVGISLSNIGTVIGGIGQKVPWNLRIGASYKPTYMPIRISLTVTDLPQWDIVNYDSTQNATGQRPGFGQQAIAHLVIGTEIILGKRLSAFVGFQPRRRMEAQLPEFGGFTGFSLGLEARIKMFQLGYGVGFYNLAGGTHQITLNTQLQEFFPKERTMNTPIPGLE